MVEAVVETKKPTKAPPKEPSSKTGKTGRKKVLKKKGRPKKQTGTNNGDVVGTLYEKGRGIEVPILGIIVLAYFVVFWRVLSYFVASPLESAIYHKNHLNII